MKTNVTNILYYFGTSGTLAPAGFIVETSNFKAGIYYIYAINKGAVEETAKVVIE